MKSINITLKKQQSPSPPPRPRQPQSQSQCGILLKIIHVNTTDISEQVDPDSPYHTAWQDSFCALLHVNYDKPLKLQVGSSIAPGNPSFSNSLLFQFPNER